MFGLAAAASCLIPCAASAAVDLSGYYASVFHEDQPERVPGPEPGDYTGLPINDASRSRANTWTGSMLTLPERQCIGHPSTYGTRSVGNLHFWDTRDLNTQELIKYNVLIVWANQYREIWMDGRPEPEDWVMNNWQGFSTGRWDGDVLEVKTTHLKEAWIRRNGLPLSDKATMVQRWYKYGDILHIVSMITDPVYMTEPLVRTTIYKISAAADVAPYPCRPAVEVERPAGEVPHNEFHDEAASIEISKRFNIPIEAVRGGAETALPEFLDKLKTQAGGRSGASGR